MTNITELLEAEWEWIFAFAAMIFAVYPIAKDIIHEQISALSTIVLTIILSALFILLAHVMFSIFKKQTVPLLKILLEFGILFGFFLVVILFAPHLPK